MMQPGGWEPGKRTAAVPVPVSPGVSVRTASQQPDASTTLRPEGEPWNDAEHRLHPTAGLASVSGLAAGAAVDGPGRLTAPGVCA